MTGEDTRTCVVAVAVAAVVVADTKEGIEGAWEGKFHQTGHSPGGLDQSNSSQHLLSHCCCDADEKSLVSLKEILLLKCFEPGLV